MSFQVFFIMSRDEGKVNTLQNKVLMLFAPCKLL